MTTIQATLAGLRVGAAVRHQNLTMYPLFAARDIEPDYLTLDEALGAGQCRITETSHAGTVPELAFENLSSKPVLLLDGEELVGAKQNRVLNLTILIGGMCKVTIPVSCVEQGRWHHQSGSFASGERTLYARGRAAKMEQVSMRLAANMGPRSDQGAIWDDIAQKSARLGVRSHTGAASEMYESRRGTSEEFRRAIRWQKGQVGALFAINGEIAGIDVFESSAVLVKVMPKLVESYALDAIDVEVANEAHLPLQHVQGFLEQLGSAKAQAFAAVGQGEDLRYRRMPWWVPR